LYKPAAAILVGEKYSAALGTALQKVYPRENVTRTTAMTSTATTFTRGAPDIPEHELLATKITPQHAEGRPCQLMIGAQAD
jgi:hypothetical protein